MILVTGATGRVGYHLMAALADAGAEATAMVRVEAKGEDLPGPGKHIVAAFDQPPAAKARCCGLRPGVPAEPGVRGTG